MKRACKRLFIVIFFTWILIAAVSADAAALPEGLVMREAFKQGVGAPVGRILQVQGRVVIVHADQKEGYWASKALPLFKRDLLVTLPNGRVGLELVDETKITLSSDTKIEINESLYSPKKSRFSYIRMAWGKARFLVKKLADLRRSRFRVSTVTAIVGVRGTEFIVVAEPDRTIVYSVKDPIEVTSLAAPDKVVQLRDSEKTTILEGQLPTDPIRVDPSEIDRLNEYFIIVSTPAEAGPAVDIEKKSSEKAEPAHTQRASPLGVYSGTGFLVPEKELVEPEESPEQIGEVITPEIIQEIMQSEQQEIIQEQDDIIKESVKENIEQWPTFPPTPE